MCAHAKNSLARARMTGPYPRESRAPKGCSIGRVNWRYRRFTLAPGGARRSRLRLLTAWSQQRQGQPC